MTFSGKKKDSAENVADAAKEKDASPATGILKNGPSANAANRYKTSTFATKNILTSGSHETASNKNGSASATNGQPPSGPAVVVPTEPSKKEVMIKGKKHFFSSLPSSNPDLPREKPGLQWMYVYLFFIYNNFKLKERTCFEAAVGNVLFRTDMAIVATIVVITSLC
jgi:hypothetical protein